MRRLLARRRRALLFCLAWIWGWLFFNYVLLYGVRVCLDQIIRDRMRRFWGWGLEGGDWARGSPCLRRLWHPSFGICPSCPPSTASPSTSTLPLDIPTTTDTSSSAAVQQLPSPQSDTSGPFSKTLQTLSPPPQVGRSSILLVARGRGLAFLDSRKAIGLFCGIFRASLTVFLAISRFIASLFSIRAFWRFWITRFLLFKVVATSKKGESFLQLFSSLFYCSLLPRGSDYALKSLTQAGEPSSLPLALQIALSFPREQSPTHPSNSKLDQDPPQAPSQPPAPQQSPSSTPQSPHSSSPKPSCPPSSSLSQSPQSPQARPESKISNRHSDWTLLAFRPDRIGLSRRRGSR